MPDDALQGGYVARGLGHRSDIHWPLVRSSQIFELRYGKALVEADRRSGRVPVFGTNGRTGTHDVALFAGPGVILGRKGAGHLGVHWSSGDYWVIDTAYSLATSAAVDLKYAYYLIGHVGLDHLKHGTSNPSLTRDAFAAQYFPVPPLGVQQEIAKTLTALDDKTASNQRALTTALEILDAMAARWSLELPAVPLASLVTINRRTAEPTAMGLTRVHHYSLPAFDGGGLPDRVSAEEIKSNKIEISGPSVLVSRLNPRIDRMWWVNPRPDSSSLASTEFACLEAADGVDLAAVWLAVRDPVFRSELVHRVTGTSGSHQRVRPDDLLAILVMDVGALPQESVADARALLAFTEQTRLESQRLANLRDVLLPELLSGRMRVGDPEEGLT